VSEIDRELQRKGNNALIKLYEGKKCGGSYSVVEGFLGAWGEEKVTN